MNVQEIAHTFFGSIKGSSLFERCELIRKDLTCSGINNKYWRLFYKLKQPVLLVIDTKYVQEWDECVKKGISSEDFLGPDLLNVLKNLLGQTQTGNSFWVRPKLFIEIFSCQLKKLEVPDLSNISYVGTVKSLKNKLFASLFPPKLSEKIES
jgi:hypothetical protein